MAAVSASATLVTGTVPGKEIIRLSDDLTPFTFLFAKQDGGRPLKKRKTGSGRGVATDGDGMFDESKSIVLAKVSLELKAFESMDAAEVEKEIAEHGIRDALDAAEVEKEIAEHGIRDALDVSLESFVRTSETKVRTSETEDGEKFESEDSTNFRLVIRNPRKDDCVVSFHGRMAADDLESVSPHLELIAREYLSINWTKFSTKSRAAFSRCRLIPPVPGRANFVLEAGIRWVLGLPVAETVTPHYAKSDLRILSTYFPNLRAAGDSSWGLSDFYTSVHVPPQDLAVAPQIQKALPETALYPFQQRAVDWLLRREGVEYSKDGSDCTQIQEDAAQRPVSLKPTQDANGRSCYVSLVRGLVVTDPSTVYDSSRSLRGGILAEEMGLGKTVELVALMRLHQRQMPKGDVFDAYTGTSVHSSGATLIISPPSILEQWRSEIERHAPGLKVFHYEGLPPPSAPKKRHEAATVENLLRYDVVLTTYHVLSREIHFAKPPPDRSLRHEKQHAARKCPLVQISWWRVCLDEAQMVENGVSQAATVARIIPRCNAWAVSGTPLRKDIQDLRGLLNFLRYEPFAGSKAVWDRLDKPSFQEIFETIAMRHTKEKIRDELRLPPQKRVVITVPFTAIEEQNYAEMMRQMCDACGLTREGHPIEEDRDATHPEVIERMREWLIRLRQTCLHAHVGGKNRRALRAKNGPLRSIHEVLEVMIDQADTLVKTEAREFVWNQVRCGHVMANAKTVETRAITALPFYEEAFKDAQGYVQICRDELLTEQKRLGKSTTNDEQDIDEDEEDKEGQEMGRIPVIRKTLRSFLELEHACKFFIGTSHYQIKANETLVKPDSEEFHQREKLETEWYDQAKKIRKELLRQSQRRAQEQMNKISVKKPFFQIPEIADLPELGGIEGKKILETMDNVSDLLNAQKKQIEEYRQKMAHILLLPLVDEDEGKDTTGDEYEDSTKVQDELYVYQLALRAAVADRNATVNGITDYLIEHELKQAEKMARDSDPEKQGHAPELVLKVVEARKKLGKMTEVGSLKGVVASTRHLLTSLEWRAGGDDTRAAAEHDLVQKQFVKIQNLATEHAKGILELEKEQELFRAAMNQRLEFYRQLQHISDTVAPYKEELDEIFDDQAFKTFEAARETRKRATAGHKTKYNYLINLRHENTQMDVKHDCIICQDEFEIGVLTSCGHKYCKECINHWWHAHRTCPLCKVKLRTKDFTDITLKPSTIQATEESHDIPSSNSSSPNTPGSSSTSTPTSIYSDINSTTLKEIQQIDLEGSYGSKVDMIARHLLWIRANDPGAKSLIFSQFSDFLSLLCSALATWKIGCASISDKKRSAQGGTDGITLFKSDPACEAFLLDAKSDSSGLTLVNATYVFLCEPLINAAIELQAIARVHRIGQQRRTTVFMYLVADTVEEAIYDISVARRLGHIRHNGHSSSTSTSASSSTSNTDSASSSKPASGAATPALQETTIEAANSLEVQSAPLKQLLRKKGDGEIVAVDDLWSCLFRKSRRERERGKDKGLVVREKEVSRFLRAEAADKRAVGCVE